MKETKSIPRMLSLRYKLLIALMTLTTVFFIAGYYGAQSYLKRTINGMMKEDIDLIMNTVADCIDEEALKSLQAEKFQYSDPANWATEMTDTRYWEQQKCLDNPMINAVAEVFTYYQDGEILKYGLDQYATLDPEKSYPFGSQILREADDDYESFIVGLTEAEYYDELTYFPDDDIYYFGASSPLVDEKGEAIGGITVYLDAGVMTEQLNYLSGILGRAFLGAYALVALLALAVTRNVTSQLTELNQAANRIADGDYRPIALKSQFLGDEVTGLAEVFNKMTEKVQGREQDLKQKVEELEIVVDLEQKEQDVKAIKDSAYFQDVKARAAEIRKKRLAEKGQGENSA